MYLQKVMSRNNFFMFFVGVLKVNDGNSRIRIQILIHCSEAWIPGSYRYPTKMSWIRNTGFHNFIG
jgi:hypothetical protein